MKRLKTIITLTSENVADNYEFEEGSAEAYGDAVMKSMHDLVDHSQVDEIQVRVVIEEVYE